MYWKCFIVQGTPTGIICSSILGEPAASSQSEGCQIHALGSHHDLLVFVPTTPFWRSLQHDQECRCGEIFFPANSEGLPHHIEASVGFSNEVDTHLVTSARLDSCPERERCIVLLMDEMHVRQDIGYDRTTGKQEY